MRKVISILLSISLIITFCNSTAFAGSDNTIDAQTKSTDEINISEEELSAIIIGENINYGELRCKIIKDMIKLGDAYIEPELCVPKGMDQDGLIVYDIVYPSGIVNQVKTEQNSDGCTVLHFYEGNLYNEVVILKNGNLLIDGQLVSIKYDNINKEEVCMFEKHSNVTPRMRNEEYSLYPWGKTSDYSIYRYTKSADTCSWGVATLIGLTTSAVATIICSAVNAGLGLAIGVSIFSSVASSMISRCQIYGMEDSYFSWRFDVYERKDSMSIDRYYKYTGACYSKRNLGGTAYAHTYYYRNWFS